MATIAGRKTIARPGPDARQLPYGLFSVANGPLPMPDHAAVGGLDYQTPFCGMGASYAVNCPPGSKAASLTGGFTNVTGDPFVVLAGMECGTIGIGPDGDPDVDSRNLVVGKLEASEQRVVENVFSRGLSGQAPGLSTGGATTVVTPTTDNLVNALQALEGAYGAAFGLPGVIHLPLKAVGQLMAGHQVERDAAGVWRTAVGTAVSIGNYAGYGPTDVAPADAAHRWIYMTGPVNVWRTDVFVAPWDASIDKATNQIHRYAERTYVVTYECVSFAVLANIEACC